MISALDRVELANSDMEWAKGWLDASQHMLSMLTDDEFDEEHLLILIKYESTIGKRVYILKRLVSRYFKLKKERHLQILLRGL